MLDEGNPSVIGVLLTDREKLADVLWFLSAEQAESQRISEDDFLDALDADALTQGWGAVADAFVNFCRPESREAIAKAIEKQTVAIAKAGEAMLATVNNPAIDAMIDDALATASREAMTNLKTIGPLSPS